MTFTGIGIEALTKLTRSDDVDVLPRRAYCSRSSLARLGLTCNPSAPQSNGFSQAWKIPITGCEFSVAQELLVLAKIEGNSGIRAWRGQKNAEDSVAQHGTRV